MFQLRRFVPDASAAASPSTPVTALLLTIALVSVSRAQDVPTKFVVIDQNIDQQTLFSFFAGLFGALVATDNNPSRRLFEPRAEQRWLGRKPALLSPYERFDRLGFSNAARSCRRAPFRRPEISFTQGDKWNALIKRYISVIPLIGDEPCIAMQGVSGWPLKKPVHKAMIANVGAAARPSHRAMSGAALPPPAQVSTS